jgi:hypothetical protein
MTLLFAEDMAQTVEPALPERPSFGDPLLGEPQSHGLDATGAHSPTLLRLNEVAPFEHLEVLYDGGEGDAEPRREIGDRSGPPTQPLHHRAAGGVGQRVKDLVDAIVVKHRLKYSRGRGGCQASA